METRICSVPDCNTRIYAKGLCSKHYNRKRLRGTTDDPPKKGWGPCKVEGCDRPSIARHMCTLHYGRWKRSGRPGPAELIYSPRAAECSIGGCGEEVYAKGWCWRHYENNRRRGNPLTDGPGRKWRLGESKWEGKTCAADGCDRPAKTSGYCTMHYDRLKRLGEVGPAAPLRAPKGQMDYIDVHGYRVVSHPDTGQAILMHRLVMEQVLGRSLRENENVHHRNGDRLDNRPQNLELWVKSQPCGQRVTDLVAWAKEIIDTYGAEAEREKRRRKTL